MTGVLPGLETVLRILWSYPRGVEHVEKILYEEESAERRVRWRE